jgi:hypothetical protein
MMPRHQPAAERRREALDERHNVAVAVDRREVDRLAAAGGLAGKGRRLHRARCLLHVYQPGSSGCVGFVNHCGDRHVHECRIGHVALHVGVGELLGLDHHVQRLRAMETETRERKALHQVEHHQGGDALRVGRNLVDRPAAIARRDWIDPRRRILRKV